MIFFGLLFCFIVCYDMIWYDMFVLSQAVCDIFHTPVALYSLFVLKGLLNTNPLTN